MKRFWAIFLAVMLLAVALVGCSGGTEEEATPETPTGDTAQNAETGNDEKPYIAIVSKGFQHQFWQTVYKGSQDAAAEYNVEITFEGPPTESDISAQVDMLNNALSKNPAAICLAALDTQSVTQQLLKAKEEGIPVVGFDSGVPNAPEGTIVSTVATNNYEAAKMAAEEMFNNPQFNERLKAATEDNPVAIAVQSQDATSASIVDRTNGFIDTMKAKAEELFPGAVEVVGHQVFAKPASKPAVVSIKVTVPPSTSYTDAQAAAQTMLSNTKNLIGYFVSNEASVTGILAATSDGTELDREKGRYKDLIVVGFDAGAPQKNAVKKQYFYGSVTQDPYTIGYKAVEVAYKAINGEKGDEFIDTGAKFYTHENIDDPDIAELLYD
ncbi:ABC transporter substrate-binding protein [Mahella sp.]|uniref:ABC transporter substrate-binding protein n=1 Tax=Mahella sp. TaxID=2798721 RepID=UPI0025BF587D|nr:ABC transporter substrate-binding protein [Mahella sp.]MBZ4665527.1 sugar transporter substrate-binding protein [Mahella sp.]